LVTELSDGPASCVLEVADDRGCGGPVESSARRVPPGQHGLSEPEFGGLLNFVGVMRVPG
jgi:hypothetical protein